MVDDDEEDVYSTKRAFKKSKFPVQFRHVDSGEALLDYLDRKAPYQDDDKTPIPHVILLDINMPGMNGFHVLEKLRQHEIYHYIPVVMLTTSDAEHDILKSYQCGANSYITKPVAIDDMQDIVKQFDAYWFTLVKLPGRSAH